MSHGSGCAEEPAEWVTCFEVDSEKGTEQKVATWPAMNSHQARPAINRNVLK